MKIRDLMSHPVIAIDENATIEEAGKIMGKKYIGSLIVTRAGKPVGIFTERDLITKVIAKGLDFREFKVKDAMSRHLFVARPSISVDEAVKIMARGKFRRLPVEEGGKIIGIFTASDLIRSYKE